MRHASAAIAVLVLVLCGVTAAAQTPTPPPTGNTGQPIIVERVHDQWVIGPEYKVTSLDGDTGQLAGIVGGRIIQELFYVGGAVYWLAAGASAWDLHYGGLVIGLQMPPDRPVAFGVKGLVGVGGATGSVTAQEVLGHRLNVPTGRIARFGHRPTFVPGFDRVELSETFLVFEPQGTLSWRVTKRIRFGVSAGYRFAGSPDVYVFDDRLNGATGAVSVQVGLGGS